MKTRCPCCGATLSLDALIAHESAREVLQAAFRLSIPLGSAVVRYLALFRPKAQDLSMARLAKLLNEILPDIQAQRISRDGQVFPAPLDAWLYAIDQALAARDDGRLKTPLKGHGWLYEVIANWRPAAGSVVNDGVAVDAVRGAHPTQSKTLATVATLESMKSGSRG